MRSSVLRFLLPCCVLVALGGCAVTDSKDKASETLADAGEKAAAVADAATDTDGTAEKADAAGKSDKAAKGDKAVAAKSDGEGDEKAKAGKKKEDDDEDKDKSDDQKKWDKALKDLTQSKGLFTTYHGDQKLLLELDEKAMKREFLYFAALNSGAGSSSIYRGAMLDDSPFVLNFERRGKKKVALMAENLAYFEGEDARQERVLVESISDGIVRAFDIVAELEDEKRVLIDLGSWFMSDNLQLAKRMRGKFSASKDLSLFTEIKSFPRNLEVYQELVLTGSDQGSGNSAMADGRGTLLSVQHSLVAPPRDGYKPREFDQRVGFFYTERKQLFDRESDDPVKRFINRWRLVKKDPTADVCDPVEPIVYWVENSTPALYRQAVKEGIEAWEPAFRKAGFSNAIIAKQMPDDADWDPADVRYPVVRWSEDENVGFAIGPSRVDPRTGEIFDADITMQAGFLNSYAERFDTYVANRSSLTKEQLVEEFQARIQRELPEDLTELTRCQLMGEERALQIAAAHMLLPMVAPDLDRTEFLQDMIREVTAHEVGHTLGLRHNFKSSVWRDANNIHDAAETSASGIYGSFMEYAPPVIAPPSQEQGQFFQSVIGPYDFWAIEYGYTEYGSNEDAALRSIASRSHTPGLEYGTDEDSYLGDPFTTVWDMGSNPIDFARQQIELAQWGLSEMLERAAEDGDGYHKYSRYYSMFQFMFNRAYQTLDRFVGGYTFNRDVVGQAGGRPPIVVVDANLQREALDLMIDAGLTYNGNIPADQRLLLANKKYGSFGSWFDPWSMDPLPRLVNRTRFITLLPLMSTSMYERLESQSRYVSSGGLSIREVADRVFDAVWPLTAGTGRPDEHDLWLQSDYIGLLLQSMGNDTTPQVTALFHELLGRAEGRLLEYAGSGDPTVAAHGNWLIDRIRRYRERQKIEF